MKILVVVGEFLQANSSANLCHLAYLRGLVEAGYDVTLLSSEGEDQTTDPAMHIPDSIRCYTVKCKTLYEKLSNRKRQAVIQKSQGVVLMMPAAGTKQKVISAIKKSFLSFYGPHGIYSKFAAKAGSFESKEDYDYLISISTPPSSHLAAHRLISSGRVKCGHWIQIWEDPWYADAFGFNKKPSILREERRLLSFAESICYVSPITLENQKKLFPESADKMYWAPLPAYYPGSKEPETNKGEGCFGYFGDYAPVVRNLEPFYEAAKHQEMETYICGNSSRPFPSAEHIHVHPRMPLDKLRAFEEKTNALVFLCNRAGGQIPGKIYQYSATHKWILFILDGPEEEKKTLRAFFEPFHRYVFCDNTVESIEEAIRRIRMNDCPGISNEPLTQFEPANIIRTVLREG